MSTLPTFQALYDAGKAEVQARFSRFADWAEGSGLDALIGAGAVLADEVIGVIVNLFRVNFLDGCEGAEIDAWAADRYGTNITRKAANAAVGEVTFTRTGTTGNLAFFSGFQVSGKDDDDTTITFQTTQPTVIPDGSTSVTVAAACTTAGTLGNVTAAFIDTLVSSISDSTVTVTNADRFTGGTAEESDAAFKARLRRYPATLSKATGSALKEAALSVPGIEYASVDESSMLAADGGIVYVYVGDPDANSNTTLAALAQTAVDATRAAGIYVVVQGAAREEISLSLTVKITAGADKGAIKDAVRAAIQAYTDGLDPAETLYRSRVEAAAISAHDAVVSAQETALSAEETTPTATKDALRVKAEDIAVTLTEVT